MYIAKNTEGQTVSDMNLSKDSSPSKKLKYGINIKVK